MGAEVGGRWHNSRRRGACSWMSLLAGSLLAVDGSPPEDRALQEITTQCASPAGIQNVFNSDSCGEGPQILDGAMCTPLCGVDPNTGITFVPSESELHCGEYRNSNGDVLFGLNPPTFACLEEDASCNVPGVEHANATHACLEGHVISTGANCTTSCEYGYVPSVATLHCEGLSFVPVTFVCEEVELGPECSAHPACAVMGLVGACCPTIGGQNQECCDAELPAPTLPTSTAAPVQDLSVTGSLLMVVAYPLSFVDSAGVMLALREGIAAAGNADVGTVNLELSVAGRRLQAAAPGSVRGDFSVITGDAALSGTTRAALAATNATHMAGILNLALGNAQQNVTVEGVSDITFAAIGTEPVTRTTTTTTTTTTTGPPCVVPQDLGPLFPPQVCQEGTNIPSGGRCTGMCQLGHQASPPFLPCLDGVLLPGNFTCQEADCAAPPGIANAAIAPCSVGATIPSGGNCTPQCQDITFTPNVSILMCSLGTLTPWTFGCIGSSRPSDTVNPTTGLPQVPSTVAGILTVHFAGQALVMCSDAFDLGFRTSLAEAAEAVSLGNYLYNSSDVTSLVLEGCNQSQQVNQSTPAAAGRRLLLGRSLQSEQAIMGRYNLRTAGLAGANALQEGISEHPTAFADDFGAALSNTGGVTPSSVTVDQGPTIRCRAPGVPNAPEPSCSEGAEIDSGSTCTTLCLPGAAASLLTLFCSNGVLEPAGFACNAGCDAPTVASSALTSCLEGAHVNTGSACTASCSYGFTPSLAAIECTNGVFNPPTFTCVLSQTSLQECLAPEGIQNTMAAGPCVEGAIVASGGACTTACAEHYAASTEFLDCNDGTLTPTMFVCVATESSWGMMSVILVSFLIGAVVMVLAAILFYVVCGGGGAHGGEQEYSRDPLMHQQGQGLPLPPQYAQGGQMAYAYQPVTQQMAPQQFG